MEHRTMRKSFIAVLLPSHGAAIALLSVFPAAAMVGGHLRQTRALLDLW
jgi:hypothetical protein